MRYRAHPLLLSDELWPVELPPASEDLTRWQQAAVEAYSEIEGVWINESVRTGEYLGRYARLHDELVPLARPIMPGAVLWRGGHWEGGEIGSEHASPTWLSCTMRREIAQHFVKTGGYNRTHDQQRVLRIVCDAGVQAVAMARLIAQSNPSCSIEEQEVMLLPGTRLRLERQMRSGILYLRAMAGKQPEALWHGAHEQAA
jgi:hypothetical protein